MWVHLHSHGHRIVGRVYDYLEDLQPGLARKVFGGVVTSAAVSYLAMRGYRYYRARQVGKERGEAARQACHTLRDYLAEREQEEGPVDREKEAMIVSLGLKDLTAKLQKGDLKAVQVLRAYQRKALEINDQLNCITEPLLEAEARAMALDLLPPNQRGPLHGVPVSIKDSFCIEGHDCHIGLTYFVGKPAKKDAEIVQLLKCLGAVPFVLTNYPQTLMTVATAGIGRIECKTGAAGRGRIECKRDMFACSNPIYGRTCNPHNTRRGPGGSTGGEGALIGGGGSLIGFGSDIGGSVRIPCQMCGVFGLKPTVDRLSFKGHMHLASGQTIVRPTVGPMARDLDSLIQVSRELFTPTMHSLDPVVPPLTFRQELFEKKGPLRVGFFTTIEEVRTHPACARAVLEAKAALERKGHKVIQFNPPRAYEVLCEAMTALFADDGEDTDPYLKNDVLDECMATFYYARRLPLRVRYIIYKLIGFFDPAFGQMGIATCCLPKKIVDLWHLQDKVQAYKAEFLEAWTSHQLDALICPGLPFPALTSGTEDIGFPGLVYTGLYNLLNYPAGVMPVSKVTPEDVRRLKDPSVYPQSGALQKLVVQDCEGSEGLPVGVQCVALPFQEEMVLRVMKDIDTVIRQ